MEVIVNQYEKKDCIWGVTGYVTDDNKVIINWEWPENEMYNLCVVYSVSDEDETLEKILEHGSKPVIYPSQFNAYHQESIDESAVRFRLYPARKEGNSLYIVNQKTDNLTGQFVRRIKLYYEIQYEKMGLLSKYKTARIRLGNTMGLTGNEYICYRCVGGMKSDLLYGIDLAAFRGRNEFEILVDKNETVELVLTKDQKNCIELVRK